MVEAAGIEPVTTGYRNLVMARDFRTSTLLVNDMRGRLECSGVLPSALQCSPVMETFWRRRGAISTPDARLSSSGRVVTNLETLPFGLDPVHELLEALLAADVLEEWIVLVEQRVIDESARYGVL